MCNTKKCIQGYYLPYRVHLKYHYLTYESHLFIPLKITHMT